MARHRARQRIASAAAVALVVLTGCGGDDSGPDREAARACGTTVDNAASGYDLRDVTVKGPIDCADGKAVIGALSAQVQRRQAAGEDCFPGYCTADDPRPTTVAGYRCTATDDPELDSIYRTVVCRRGERTVSTLAADDE